MTRNARNEYNAQIAKIDTVIAELAKMADLAREQKHVNWADVGSIGYIAQRLDDTLANWRGDADR